MGASVSIRRLGACLQRLIGKRSEASLWTRIFDFAATALPWGCHERGCVVYRNFSRMHCAVSTGSAAAHCMRRQVSPSCCRGVDCAIGQLVLGRSLVARSEHSRLGVSMHAHALAREAFALALPTRTGWWWQ